MKVFILAAGQGTRLAPLTDTHPKCLVELGGKSLLERQVAALTAAGLDDITVIGGYRADLIANRGYNLALNERFVSTNMVATLFSDRQLFAEDQDLLIAYGDIVYEPRLVTSLKACKAPVCVVVDADWQTYWSARMADPLSDAETLKLDAAGRILELGKKPRSLEEIQGQYVGLIKVRADHVAQMQMLYAAMDRAATYDGKDFDNMFMTSFLQHMIDSDWQVQAVVVHSGWLEIDTVSDLELYEGWLKSGELGRFYQADFARA